MKNKAHQLLHRLDNGEIVIFEENENLGFVCKKCQARWVINLPIPIGVSSDFVKYEPKEVAR